MDGSRFHLHRYPALAADRVEVWDAVFTVIHVDSDAEESGDDGHAAQSTARLSRRRYRKIAERAKYTPHVDAWLVAPCLRWPRWLAAVRVPAAVDPERLATRVVPALAYVAGGHGARAQARAGSEMVERASRPPAQRLAAAPLIARDRLDRP